MNLIHGLMNVLRTCSNLHNSVQRLKICKFGIETEQTAPHLHTCGLLWNFQVLQTVRVVLLDTIDAFTFIKTENNLLFT